MAFLRGESFQKPGIRRAGVLSLLGLAVLFVGEASDARPPDRYSAAYSVTLEDEQGNQLRAFRKDGSTFVLGYEGDRYEVRLDNHTDRRVEAVVSVDGRDAISGDVGDFVHERGYVLPPHGTIRVDGFRRNLDQTAAFRFTAPSSSYSSRMGTPENVGVIGVAFFPERPVMRRRAPVRPPPRDYWWDAPEPNADERTPWWRHARPGLGTSDAEKRTTESAPSAASPPAPSAAPKAGAGARAAESRADRADRARRSSDYGWDDDDRAEQNRLGTEYGESTWSPVSEVSFVRQSPASPAVILTLRYDDAAGLEARGIAVYPRPYWPESHARFS